MAAQPTDFNIANSTNYQLILPKCPHVTFFCNGVKIPNVSGAGAVQNNLHTAIYHPGDRLVYDDLSFSFNLDANLENWREIYKWMKDYGMPIDPTPQEMEDPDLVQDIEIIVTTNQKLPTQRFVFVNAFPIFLQGIDYESRVTDAVVLPINVTFRYTYFDLVPLNNGSPCDELN